MTTVSLSPPPGRLALLAGGLAANAVLAAALVRVGVGPALLVAAVPAVLLGVGVLLGDSRNTLVFVALALPMTQHMLNKPYPLAGGVSIWVSDVVVGLAVSAWLAVRLLRGRDRTPAWPRTPVLGAAFFLFAGAITVAALRGNAYHGASLLGLPLRFVIYAGIAAAIAGLSAREARRGITVVFYTGTVWMMLNAVYYIGTGTSQTDSAELSTGGQRILSGTVSMYLSAAFVLALLNLRSARTASARGMHATIAFLALSGVALGFFRAVFVALALVLPFVLELRRVRQKLAGMLPLLAPFLALVAIAVPLAAPDIFPNLVDRVTASPSRDANVLWRERVRDAVWVQVHESPLIGVGFGKEAYAEMFAVSSSGLVISRRETVHQEGHNSYLWLLAAGGLVTLGAFLLLLGAYVVDWVGRLRRAIDDDERTILLFSLYALVLFLVPGLAGPVLGTAPVLLTVWVLLLLPTVVGARARPKLPRLGG